MNQERRLRVLELQRLVSGCLKKINTPDVPAAEQLDSSLSLLTAYDELAGELYQARRSLPATDPLRIDLEDRTASLVYELTALESRKSKSLSYSSFVQRYRQIWREELSLFLHLACAFLAFFFLGWNIAVNYPDLVPLLVPQSMMEAIIDRQAWFETPRLSPLFFALYIAWNNIKVALNCFIGGAALGLGGLFLVFLNAVHFGAVTGYCAVNNFHEELLGFVYSHGALELTIIVCSGFASVLYGRVFFLRPYSLFIPRMREGARRAGYVILGVTPWLILAAFFEAFVSPWNYFSESSKLLIGLSITALFWIWTFAPIEKDPKH